MTTKTLIALVDGSAYSESVCRHAAWIADKTKWKVKLYHVMNRRDDVEKQDLSGAIRLGARSELLAQLSELDAARAKLSHAHGRAILEDAKALIAGDGVIEVETRLRQGDLVETVTAKDETGDMIVVGKRGETAGLALEHIGSNLERIVRASHKPVFIANRAFKQIEKVLVAFDGASSSLKAVDFIARSPLFVGLKVALVFAGKDTPEMTKALDSAVSTLKAGGIEAETIIQSGEPEKVLSQLTAHEGYDLLVMGAYGHSRIRSLLIGSTTTEMIRLCHVPVLIMR
ncbi:MULTISPECIES: universal stress protein [Roseobacteraceae]|jgi:nucleotide-binding universal stress UspA family protein|uniref:UspA domain-containing protein n=1 Tax=Celeribacter baekdonensis B30 TaxID=1208323 RepID=K2JJP9_9RHOB|nr:MULTISPECIES: universal stress protein [Roseobacteraceae]EKE74642.1 UspA domain-containing protein [Celeribacter baekdonensis B30]KAB6714697.1 universal stress protein UspA [Roseobacter sp. TSBP12]|tara:strand:+ start:6112 stop:6969 length:858 start_codon:yes stop_codon:yes gene_type:complete